MSERLYNDIIQGLREVRQHLRGEITLRVTTLSTDDEETQPMQNDNTWYSVNGDGDGLKAELLRELAPTDALANADLLEPVTRRFDRDDVVFRVEGAGEMPFVRVHLTYDGTRRAAQTAAYFPTLEAATAA